MRGGNDREQGRRFSGVEERRGEHRVVGREELSRGRPSGLELAPLPDGWKQFADPSTGRAYYRNEASAETVWERPAAADAVL